MYPLNVSLPAPAIGFAVANDETEHAALTDAGYVPALVKAAQAAAPQEAEEQPTPLQPLDAPDGAAPDADPAESEGEGHTVETARAQLDALDIAYDRRLGLAKLLALLPA